MVTFLPSALKMTSRHLTLALHALFGLSMISSTIAAPALARKAEDFVAAQGVCLHVQNFNDEEWKLVKKHLGDLGIRYYRDGLEHADNPVYKARYQDLYDSYGMKMLAVCGPYGCDPLQPQNGSLDHIIPRVAALKHLILAVEGPNEPEYFWHDGWKYGGFEDRPSQVVWYQNLLYDTLKKDPSTKDIPVTTFAAARVETPQNWYSSTKPLIKHDIGSYHHYNGTYLPNPYDTVRNLREFYSSDKPLYLTEHGYRIRGDGQVSIKGQMKLNTRSMVFFYDWDNTQKLFMYVAGPDTADGEDYGLANKDFSPRPAYQSMKDVIAMCKEATWNTKTKTWSHPEFTPGKLDYTLSGDTQDFGWRLVQKSDGSFLLMSLPYINVSNPDGSDITNPLKNITLTFPTDHQVEFCQVDEETGKYKARLLSKKATSVSVGLPDSVGVFKITPLKLAK